MFFQVSAIAGNMQKEALAGMQDAVRSLRCSAAIPESAHIPDPSKDSADLRTLKSNIPPLAAWTGPPHGTFLTYALLHWAASAPDAEVGERASAFLNCLCQNYRVALGKAVEHTRSPIFCSCLEHPVMLSRGSPTQRRGHLRQQKHHRGGNVIGEPGRKDGGRTALQHVHIFQQNVLLCEQLLRCTRMLKRLVQLLHLCKAAMQPCPTGPSPPKYTSSETVYKEICLASSHVVRLAAFLFRADSCKAVCGIWIRKHPHDKLLCSSQEGPKRCSKGEVNKRF